MANYEDNEWTLVYDGAIEENAEGAVNLHEVRYPNSIGLEIAANLYLPAGYSEGGSYAAVVVAHPNGGVKEQVAGLFAQRLASHGYIAMAYDAAYQGASAGEPRQTDRPASRVEETRQPGTPRLAWDEATRQPGATPVGPLSGRPPRGSAGPNAAPKARHTPAKPEIITLRLNT